MDDVATVSATRRKGSVSAKLRVVADLPEVAAVRARLAAESAFRRANGLAPGEGYAGRHDFIAQHGVGWLGPIPLPRGLRYLAPKQCFTNAFRLYRRHPTLYQYVEGVVFIPDMPIDFHHAWVVRRRDGRLIDQTLFPTRYRQDQVPWTYLGVPFEWEVINPAYAISELQGGFLDDWRSGFPLLQAPYDPATTPERLWDMYERLTGRKRCP